MMMLKVNLKFINRDTVNLTKPNATIKAYIVWEKDIGNKTELETNQG